MISTRTLTIAVIAGCVLMGLLAAGYWATHGGAPRVEDRLAEAPKGPPQLRCVLIGYTGQPRLEFLFDINRAGGELRFDQRYLVELSGSDKTIKEPPFPAWRFDTSAEPARLESEINVFDNTAAGSHTETITIEIYGYHPERPGGGWIESGLKSIHYQNLSGQCRQSRPMPLTSTEN